MPDGLRPPYDVGDGRTCSDMLGALPLVQYMFVKAGWIQEDFSGLVMQWSGRTDVSASASTHASGAVFDVAYRLVDSDAKLRTWQRAGFTPFPRVPPTFPYHGHVLVNGCSHLHWSADNQITAARNGRDGLVRNGPYPGPTDVGYRSWQRAQQIYADLVEEMNMPTVDEIADAVLARRGQIADTVATRELKLSDKAEDAIAVRVRDRMVNDRVIPTWHPEPEGGWPAGKEPGPWTLHALLRSIRQETNAAATREDLTARIDALSKKIDALAALVKP